MPRKAIICVPLFKIQSMYSDENSYSSLDMLFMQRALSLARQGVGTVRTNPMVGAVIVSPDDRIIGEGWHRAYGGPHAEVNAIGSIPAEDRHLLSSSRMYVTLEPCSHYGKTPPCASLLIAERIPAIIIATKDPFAKVAGRGIAMLEEAGCEVKSGLCEEQSHQLNARFFTAHTHHRPFIFLKWAQSADGYIDWDRKKHENAYRFSSRMGTVAVHKLRSEFDAIMVGGNTSRLDEPRLDVRFWKGISPKKIILHSRIINEGLHNFLNKCYLDGINSILVEGGLQTINTFIENGLWDCARIECSDAVLHPIHGTEAPLIPGTPIQSHTLGKNVVYYYSNNPWVGEYFINNAL